MHKKTITLLCLLLAFLFVFAACKRHSRYGTIVVDRQGMEHVIMTDANGVTVVDNDGNLVEIVTDSQNKKPIAVPTENGTAGAAQVGEYQTHGVTFPGVVEDGTAIEDGLCQVAVPQGWEPLGNGMMVLLHTATEARVQISTDVGGTLSDAVEKLNSQIEAVAPEGGSTQTNVTIDGLPATRTQYEMQNMTVISYLLMTENGKVCRINCLVETDKLDAADIDSVVRGIRFK